MSDQDDAAQRWAPHPGGEQARYPGSPWYGGGWGWGPPPGAWGPPPAPPSPGDQGRHHRTLLVTGTALCAAAAVAIGVGIGYTVWSPTPAPPASGSPVVPRVPGGHSSTTSANRISSAAGAPSNIASIADKVDPALVDINTVLGPQTAEAAGTGMVLTSTGKILTNNHVIEGATTIHATDLGNGQTYSATVIGYDRTVDVAVIQLKNASGLKTVNLGDSGNLSVGQAVVGIGNAGGLGGTPSKAGGSITALNQSITASDQGSSTTEHLTGLIQTNANIQAGDSGGPLVDRSGRVVGMDTAASEAQGFTFNGAVTGQGYSIPVNTAIATAKQIESGKASKTVHIGPTAFLGVGVKPLSTASKSPTVPSGSPFGFGAQTPTATPSSPQTAPGASTGAYVAFVLPGTPAQGAGIRKGDVITGLAGGSVTSPDGLTKAIEQYHPGDQVKVVWVTPQGQTQSAAVTLVNGPAG